MHKNPPKNSNTDWSVLLFFFTRDKSACKEENMKSLEKKKIIQGAALKCFIKTGYHQTRIEDIISEASIGKGTFYLYFKNKEELVLSFIDELNKIFNEIHLWIMESLKSNVDLKQLFKNEGKQIIIVLNENRKLASFLLNEGMSISPKVKRRIKAFYEYLTSSAERSYTEAQKIGLLKDISAKYAAYCVVGGISHIYHLWLEGSIKEDVDLILQSTLDFYLQALLKNN